MKEIELIGKRKPREKHFLQKDGTIIAKIYDTDVHYLKDGKYEEIDNTLVNENGTLINKSNDYKVEFKDDFRKSLMKMSKNGNYIDFKIRDSKMTNMKAEKRKLVKQRSNITYNDITDDITIEYQTLANKVKETIILQNANYSKLEFELNTNLILLEENGEIIAKDITGKIIFRIEKPYMVDSNNIRNDNIHYVLNSFDDAYLLTLVLDDEWLNSNERKYPIYIDPTITNESLESELQDTYIYPGDTGVDKNSKAVLKAGIERVNGENIENRTLIKFGLPEISTGSEIVDAQIQLIGYVPSENHDIANSKLVTIHRVTEDWTETGANWEQMNNKFDNRVEAVVECWRSSLDNTTLLPTYVGGDITNLVKKWYRNTANYGILIQSVEKQYIDADYQAFFSKNNTVTGSSPKPMLFITYRNQNGLESYLDYKEQSFVDEKTYANTYNGNMTAIFNIGQTNGGNMPAQVDLVYNTDDVVLNNQTFFGKGFKLNLEQTIREENTISDIVYLEYLDEDGTKHYFSKESEDTNVYYDEDGIGMQIEKNENSCVLKDKIGNSMTFIKNNNNNVYYLTEIKDTDENTISIQFDSDNRIVKVQDKYNTEINFTYSIGLIEIASPSEIVKLNYLNDKLVSIVTKNGTTNIEYNDNNLISGIIDINGLKVNYEYYENKPYKMKKISHYGLNNVLGQILNFEYGFNTTRITDNKDRTETIIYNSEGNVVSRNNLKSNEDIDGAYSTTQTYGMFSDNKNKITSSSISVTHIKNYLKNTGFETDTATFSVSEDSNITTSYSTEYYHSGYRSLKITSMSAGQSIEQTISVPKGEYYTFSGYFKIDEPATLSLSYGDKNGKNIIISEEMEYNNEFVRHDVTIYYDEEATTDLKISISFPQVSVIYMDDIQLEKGEVANLYNMIENSDFSEGILDWTLSAHEGNQESANPSQYFNVVKFNNEKNTALKVSMNPLNGTVFNKKFPIKGKKGDLYTVSFWYKNEGVPVCRQYAGNYVMINFKPTDGEAEYCVVGSPTFNTNENIWQYFTYRDYALEDYDEIDLRFIQDTQANDFYITNLSFYKEVTSGDYQYDENGNLVSIANQSEEKTEFKYNQNNQLVSAVNSKGKSLKYEYDNLKKDRVLRSFSSNGIVNETKYDSNGNIIKTKISRKYINELQTGEYKIRSKGTDKYIKAELNMILLEDSQCSNTIWKIEKNEDQIKIFYSVLPNYSISYNENQVFLSTATENNTFNLEKNENGSYHIAVYNTDGSKKYLKANDSILLLENLEIDNPSFEFYIELLEDIFIEKSKSYSEDGRFISNTIDSNFNKTTYEFDNITGMIKTVSNPNEHIITYNYNNKNQLQSIMYGDRIVSYSYNDKNVLSQINQGSKQYNFQYDEFLNVKQINIGDEIVLVANTYELNNGNPISKTYGNNQCINYDYDDFDRLKKITMMDDSYNYKYDNNGNIAKVISNYGTEKYNYDVNNRLYRHSLNDFKVKYTYDSNNNINKKEYQLNSLAHTVTNIFNNNDQVITTSLNNQNINYGYDSLSRLIAKNINNNYYMDYEYISNGNRTTNLIKSIKNGSNKYEYNYDNLNNISEVYYNGTLINQYYYDDYNILIKEIDLIRNLSIEYTYDNSGNLTTEITKNFDTGTIIKTDSYQYENNNWEDQLTKYNENSMTYDQIGNMLTIGNNISMSWINGRLLNTYNNLENNLSISYKYNADGIRKSKVINNIETQYHLEGNSIIYEKTGDKTIYYLYDMTGLIGLEYNNNTYYYLKNLHGDIIGILNNNYEQIVTYRYDSWGKLLNVMDENGNEISDLNNIGYINPFRYRGYYYDSETELYYLNSRYYNPAIKRFISADNYISTDTGLLGHNMYIYANDNPITYVDYNGDFAHIGIIAGVVIIGSIIGGAFAANSKKQNKKAQKEIAEAQKKKKKAQKNKNDAKKFEQTLKNNAATVKEESKNMNPVQKVDYFIENVKTGGQYDLKNTGEWEEDIYYDGKVMESQDIGNYHFGYIGRAMGYDVEFLTFGAGLYQVKSGTSNLAYCFSPSFCDDPRDSYYIRLGAIAYDNEN